MLNMNNFLVALSLILVGLTFTILILRYTLSGQSKLKEAFIAIDGTKFSTKKDCDNYDYLYKLMECLYQEEALTNARRSKEILGLRLLFVNQIKSGGFKDLKTLISFKDDFKKLAELLDPKEILESNKNNLRKKN